MVPVSTPAAAQRGQIGGIYYKDDLIAAPMEYRDGAIRVPTGPGLGIDVDSAKIEQYRVEGLSDAHRRSSRASAGSWPTTGSMR